jgi:hypothetical protein
VLLISLGSGGEVPLIRGLISGIHASKSGVHFIENYNFMCFINPLNAQLNPICHLLALFGAHPILHISKIRVNDILDGLYDITL